MPFAFGAPWLDGEGYEIGSHLRQIMIEVSQVSRKAMRWGPITQDLNTAPKEIDWTHLFDAYAYWKMLHGGTRIFQCVLQKIGRFK